MLSAAGSGRLQYWDIGRWAAWWVINHSSPTGAWLRRCTVLVPCLHRPASMLLLIRLDLLCQPHCRLTPQRQWIEAGALEQPYNPSQENEEPQRKRRNKWGCKVGDRQVGEHTSVHEQCRAMCAGSAHARLPTRLCINPPMLGTLSHACPTPCPPGRRPSTCWPAHPTRTRARVGLAAVCLCSLPWMLLKRAACMAALCPVQQCRAYVNDTPDSPYPLSLQRRRPQPGTSRTAPSSCWAPSSAAGSTATRLTSCCRWARCRAMHSRSRWDSLIV